MQKFNSIEQFRNVIRHVRENSAYHGRPIPTIEFEGTVKLHGTNAGVRVYADHVQAQSREREISLESDNAGFAHFALGKRDAFNSLINWIAVLEDYAEDTLDGRFTIFGEWCGGNIQSKVGLNNVDKHFVIFNIYDHVQEKYLERSWMDKAVNRTPAGATNFNTMGIYFIYQVAPQKITIDFNTPEQYIEELERLTLEVEERCPWAAFRGAEGIGEGLVWTAVGNLAETRLWFKTKGVKHQGKDQSKVKTLSVDPVRVAAIRELVDVLLPEWRLEQGITFLRENGYTLEQKATGQFLAWVMKDVVKEESDTIAANPYNMKELQGYLTTAARDWYFKYLTADAIKDAA